MESGSIPIATHSLTLVLGKPTDGTTTETDWATETTVLMSTVTESATTITEGASTGDVEATAPPAMQSGSEEGTTTETFMATVTTSSSNEIVLPTVTISDENETVDPSAVLPAAATTVTIPVQKTETATHLTTTTETLSSDTRPNLGGVPQTPPAEWSSTRYVTTSYWTTITTISHPGAGLKDITTVTSGFVSTTSAIIEAVSGGSESTESLVLPTGEVDGLPTDDAATDTWTAPITLPTDWTGAKPSDVVEPTPLFPNNTASAALTAGIQNTTTAIVLSTTLTHAHPTTSAAESASMLPVIEGRASDNKGCSGGYCIVMVAFAIIAVLV